MSSQPSGIEEGKLFAFLAYLLGIIGFIIVLVAKKDNQFAMFHAKQSLVLFFACLIGGAVHLVPFIGWIVGPLVGLLVFVLWIIGMVNALTGQERELPLIGQFGRQINL